jgi:hypothetical protein
VDEALANGAGLGGPTSTTYAVHLLCWGAKLRHIADQLGHADPATTAEVNARREPTDLRVAYMAMPDFPV